MLNLRKQKKNLFKIVIIFILAVSSVSLVKAQQQPYVALAPLQTPNGTQITSNINLGQYFSEMYQLGVGIATALAVLMIIWGGVEYVTTDAIGGKEEGKTKVQNAILGLLLALGSWIILDTINPAFLNTNLYIPAVTFTCPNGGTCAPTLGAQGGLSNNPGGVVNAPANPWTNLTPTIQDNYSEAYDLASESGDDEDGNSYVQDLGNLNPYDDPDYTQDAQQLVTELGLTPDQVAAVVTMNEDTDDTNENSSLSPVTATTNANGTVSFTANNDAVDTDGTGDPGFDEGTTASGAPQHQTQTSYDNGSLNSLTNPYIAIPTSVYYADPSLLGQTVTVTDATTGKSVQAVIGDTGATGWGEMSVAAWSGVGRQITTNSVPNDNLVITLPSGAKLN